MHQKNLINQLLGWRAQYLEAFASQRTTPLKLHQNRAKSEQNLSNFWGAPSARLAWVLEDPPGVVNFSQTAPRHPGTPQFQNWFHPGHLRTGICAVDGELESRSRWVMQARRRLSEV